MTESPDGLTVLSVPARARILVALLHPLPSLATTVAAVGFGLFFGLRLQDGRLWRLALTMLLAQFSISALNDWADRARDARAGRARPLPAGLLSPTMAFTTAVACATLAVALAAGFGWRSAGLVVLGIAAGWIYDLGLKATPLSFLPFALAFPLLPLWVGVVAGRFDRSLLWLFAAGMPLATAIHLADAIPDREVDRAGGARTMAVALGRPAAERLAAFALAVGASILGLSLGGTRIAAAGGVWVVGATAAVLYLLAVRREREAQRLRVARWVLVAGAGLAAATWVAAA